MKALIFILFFGFLPASMHAQMCPCEFGSKGNTAPLKLEIGVNFFGFKENDYSFSQKPYLTHPHTFSGVIVKYHTQKISVRMSSDYYKDHYFSSWSHQSQFDNYTLDEKVLRSSLGIEKKMFGKKLKLSYLLDGILDIGSSSERHESNSSGSILLPNPYRDVKTDYKVFNIGLRAGVLLSYRPVERFSINAEAGIALMRFLRKENGGNYKYDDQLFLFSPLRLLSINYHLNIPKQF